MPDMPWPTTEAPVEAPIEAPVESWSSQQALSTTSFMSPYSGQREGHLPDPSLNDSACQSMAASPVNTSTPATEFSTIDDGAIDNIFQKVPASDFKTFVLRHAERLGLKVQFETSARTRTRTRTQKRKAETESGDNLCTAKRPKLSPKGTGADAWWKRFTKLGYTDLELLPHEKASVEDKGVTMLNVSRASFDSISKTRGALHFLRSVEAESFEVNVVQIVMHMMLHIALHHDPATWNSEGTQELRVYKTAKPTLDKICKSDVGEDEFKKVVKKYRHQGAWYLWFAGEMGMGLGSLVHLHKWVRPESMGGASKGGEGSGSSGQGVSRLQLIGLHRMAVHSGAEKLMHDLLWKVCSTFMPDAFKRKEDEAFPGVPYQDQMTGSGED